MEGMVILLLFFGLWLLVGPVIALVKAGNAARDASEAREELRLLHERMRRLEAEIREIRGLGGIPTQGAEEEEKTPMGKVMERVRRKEPQIQVAEVAPPPPLPVDVPRPRPLEWEEEDGVAASVAKLQEDGPLHSAPLREPEEAKEAFSLEHFMGVKLFAWLGGVAMFFGVIFFVKYAFENNLIPPAVRIALGFVTGTALLAGGLWTHRLPRYRILAQAFCATGVLILYGVSFAAHAIYHFAAFGPVSTFVLMGLITLVAFLVAVRLNALVVAALGMLGGFLTPVLLSTGSDHLIALFSYIALLDLGLLAVSRHRNWKFLTSSAALGTALTQMNWYGAHFGPGDYAMGARTLVPMGILLGFIILFMAGDWIGKQRRDADPHSHGAVLGLISVAMLFCFAMLDYRAVVERHFLLYGLVLLLQLAVMVLVWRRPQLGVAQLVAAGLTFLHLAIWTSHYLNAGNLAAGLALYLIFGALYSVLPVILPRRQDPVPAMVPPQVWPWFAPFVLLMMGLPLFHLSPVPMLLWFGVLAANLLVIGLAVATRAVLPALASLVMTMLLAALWLFRVPAQLTSLAPFLGVVTGFSLLFAVAGRFLLVRKGKDGQGNVWEAHAAALLPGASAVLPFVLLILALLQLPVPNPSPVFGVALLMAVMLGGLAVIARQGPLVLVALLGTLAVEGVWHARDFHAELPIPALPWYLGFYGFFLVFPFVFRKSCRGLAAPWIASALSGVGHFLLIHDLVKHAYPNGMMGLIPAAFAVPSLLALVVVLRAAPAMDQANRSQLAWFGGVALFFITLVFPIQFDRQWLTVSWALEGALLLWLFRRVPHVGLQLTGFGLLLVSFARLALNPAVFTEYTRSGTAILNWQLYAFGLVALALFAGAWWFDDPDDRWSRFHPRGILQALGGVLCFLLLNIEIADFFTDPGDRSIAFRFGGNFARDMTYSIAWGLFSLGLLGLGIWRRSKHARFAAIGLLVITLIKVFLHDLAAIENVFRIGALVGVAVIAFVASFLYQRFFDRSKSSS